MLELFVNTAGYDGIYENFVPLFFRYSTEWKAIVNLHCDPAKEDGVFDVIDDVNNPRVGRKLGKKTFLIEPGL